MKKLQEQIDALNAANKPVQSNTGKIMSLFALTSLIAYAHKLPGVSKLTNLLSLWYGRTTWWQMLIYIRKGFIVLNALIGVYATMKITGFSSNNLFAGFMAIGHSYFEMLYYGTKRLFGWIYSFFDNWIFPKPPSEPSWKVWSWGGNTYDSRPINPNILTRDTIEKYSTPKLNNSNFSSIFDSTPPNDSTWSLYNVLWYTGIAICIGGVIFIGYSLYTGALAEWISPHKSSYTAGAGAISPTSSGTPDEVPEIHINDERTPSFLNIINNSFRTIPKKLGIRNNSN